MIIYLIIYRLSGRPNENSKLSVPGPGQYGVGSTMVGPKYGFGTDKRGKE